MTILGIGRRRLVKAMTATPDLRYGSKEKPTSSESDSCRAFFNTLYFKVAESLPDKFVRRGRASKRRRTKHSHNIKVGDSSSEETWFSAEGSEDEGDDADLFAWLDKSSDTPLQNLTLTQQRLVKRFLPPGNVTGLYDHYQVTQSMLGVAPASLFGRVYFFIHLSIECTVCSF